MILTSIAIIVLSILDIYMLKQIDKHELAIVLLAKEHPEMLIKEGEDE